MTQTSPSIQTFFEKYAMATNAFVIEDLGALYASVFMFGGPAGVQWVKKEDFLMVLPKRQGFFAMVGLKSTSLTSLEETKLDNVYTMVKAVWTMHYEKKDGKKVEDDNSATYILQHAETVPEIVFQIDHQDLMEKAKGLGLV